MPPESNRRAKIVATARRKLLAQGYEGASIGEIATELGISKAAVSYYFPTKDRLLDELVEPLVQRLEGVVVPPNDDTWPERARAALSAYLLVIVDDIEIARWLDNDVALRGERHFGERLTAITARLVDIITDGRSTDLDKIGALAVIGGIWRPVLELDLPALADHHAEHLEAAMISYPPLREALELT